MELFQSICIPGSRRMECWIRNNTGAVRIKINKDRPKGNDDLGKETRICGD